MTARARLDGGGHLAAADSSTAPTCNGAPWELIGGRRLATLKLSYQQGFGLWHRSDTGRLFRLPSSGDWTIVRVTRSTSSMTWTAPTGVVDLREAPGMVGLAQGATPARQRGRAVG
jgi:hypothetical protein